jgi:hypothetical protein
VLRVSFVKKLELMRPLWLTLALAGNLLSARQKEQLTGRFLERAGRLVTRRRQRPCSCPRAVRQPVSAGRACAATNPGKAPCNSNSSDL